MPHEVQLKLLKWMFIFILILLSAYAINVILYFIDYYLCMNFIDIWMGIHQYDGTLDAYYAMPEIQEKDIEIAELKEKIRYHEERLLTHPHEKYVYTVNGVEYQSEYTRAEIAEMHGLNKKI